ncbi:MAG: hypothetical protein ACRDDY_01860 [Clostridium sp.]|uniref:hypothetical protein n=1 Tax=Clostridium sp. TaxID=1506 RepID=UPI003EE6756F
MKIKKIIKAIIEKTMLTFLLIEKTKQVKKKLYNYTEEKIFSFRVSLLEVT